MAQRQHLELQGGEAAVRCSHVDGLLVGRASWTVAGFIATYEAGLAGYRSKAPA